MISSSNQLHASFPSSLSLSLIAEPNPSITPPTPIHMAEPSVREINPLSERPPPPPDTITPIIHSDAIEPSLTNPSTDPPQKYSSSLSNHQNLNRTMTTDPSVISTQENQGLNHHLQQFNNQSHYINMNNNEPYSPPPLHPASTTPTSIALPHQYHGFLSTFFEQFLSHIVRQSSPTPPPLQQLSTPSGSFNFKVEPILLHINSSVPLLNHDQLNSSSSNTMSSSSSQVPEPNPQPPPPPKQEPPNDVTPPPLQAPQPAAGGGGMPPQSAPDYRKHQKALSKAGSLANLLPTGTVLAFQALTPTLSDSGKCELTNKVLIGSVVIVCTLICFCSSFTDSVEYNGKVYYGIASRKGLMVFNYEDRDNEKAIVEKEKETEKLKIQPIDFVHAFLSVAVFLIFAFSSSQLQDCFFPRKSKETEYSTVVYLPLVTGILSSFLFTIFPTQRKGIGYTPNTR